MASGQEIAELDSRARQEETVVPGSTSGKSLETQAHLAEGSSRGGQTRMEQIGIEKYQEMDRKGGPSIRDQSGEQRTALDEIEIDDFQIQNPLDT